jgi:hypothetical protein
VLDFLDHMLRRLLGTKVPGMTENQIGFVPPDSDWRSYVANQKSNSLDVYLVELRENRNLRSNERFRVAVNGSYQDTPAPPRLDCSYLISAWSPAVNTPLVEGTIDEHVLLYETTRVLMDAAPLDARAIYRPGGLPTGFPDALLEPPPPVKVAGPEGFARLPDFWMRMDTIWKPVVELVVTVPVVASPRLAGPPVTTLTGRFARADASAGAEELLTIGGVILAANLPVGNAWVRLVELDRIVTADDAGQYVFEELRGGTYTFQAGAVGHQSTTAMLQIPSDSGNYDISLT